MNHAERYESLITKLSSMRWRGGELDCSYQAALYLMASHPVLAEKVERYFSPVGIDFGGLMKKEEFDYDWMKMSADAARNLFPGTASAPPHPLRFPGYPPQPSKPFLLLSLLQTGIMQCLCVRMRTGKRSSSWMTAQGGNGKKSASSSTRCWRT